MDCMIGKNSTRPERAGTLKKRSKKKQAVHAVVFTYARGHETISKVHWKPRTA